MSQLTHFISSYHREKERITFYLERDGDDAARVAVTQLSDSYLQCANNPQCHGSLPDYKPRFLGSLYAAHEFLGIDYSDKMQEAQEELNHVLKLPLARSSLTLNKDKNKSQTLMPSYQDYVSSGEMEEVMALLCRHIKSPIQLLALISYHVVLLGVTNLFDRN